jgi:hypothetical protein
MTALQDSLSSTVPNSAKQPSSKAAKQPNSQTAKQPNSQTAKQLRTTVLQWVLSDPLLQWALPAVYIWLIKFA